MILATFNNYLPYFIYFCFDVYMNSGSNILKFAIPAQWLFILRILRLLILFYPFLNFFLQLNIFNSYSLLHPLISLYQSTIHYVSQSQWITILLFHKLPNFKTFELIQFTYLSIIHIYFLAVCFTTTPQKMSIHNCSQSYIFC